MENNKAYLRAHKKVKNIKEFYGHLLTYVLVISGLIILNVLTSPKHLWFYWPALGWGIGIICHGISVFNFNPFFNKEWEERKLKQFIEEEKELLNKWK
ncbi:2TM domain-containing protein [Flavobacterium agricola]|uniref:2TM domain-containing protein n=1 Tax=Flavobacterium agricola TaxID=2870839 RepID=A0ABY6LVJ9_9FLAO|nr:2TM domain-containing protein [Flavobacterium agricola]UYW00348.1 2TM domain-containing protein [Flavobacterium agricola]